MTEGSKGWIRGEGEGLEGRKSWGSVGLIMEGRGGAYDRTLLDEGGRCKMTIRVICRRGLLWRLKVAKKLGWLQRVGGAVTWRWEGYYAVGGGRLL